MKLYPHGESAPEKIAITTTPAAKAEVVKTAIKGGYIN